MPEPEHLDDWLRVMQEIVSVIGHAYHSSFKLLESNHLKNESLLELLRAVYVSIMAEVDVIKGGTEQSFSAGQIASSWGACLRICKYMCSLNLFKREKM